MTIDSNVLILRWYSGEGGDTLLNMIVGSSTNLHSNISWGDTNTNGKTIPIENMVNENFIDLPAIVDMAIGYKCNEVEVSDLANSIAQLKLLPKNFMLKSHWYKSSIFNDITIDLTTSAEMLPFVVGAAVQKNNKTITNYNQIREKITDPAIRRMYDLYNIAWHRFHNANEYSQHQIPVETLVSGWANLQHRLKQFDLLLDERYKEYYTKWLDKNQQYLPSNRYRELVESCEFDYTDKQLSTVEKYCLLAMGKKKFTILH